MKFSVLYKLALKFGSLNDPRINKKDAKKFEDSAILYGNPNLEIKKVMVGIDIEVGEIVLADRIRQAQGLDLVISHHPEGHAFAELFKIMRLQIDVLKKTGISDSVARKLLDERQTEVERRILPNNHDRAVDAARLLKMPFMCLHTVADNHVFAFLNSLMNKRKPRTVGNIVDLLLQIPEYRMAQACKVGPRIIMGSPKREAGKILMEMTGGTEGSKDVYDKLYKKGIRTLICMHLSEDHFKKAKEANLNVIIAGHISSDTLGLNLLLDNIEKETKQELVVIDCSGFHRIRRN